MGFPGWMKLTVLLGAVGLVLLTAVVYANSLGGAYILDDELIYVDDPRMLRVTLHSAFSRDVPEFIPHKASYYYYRPLTILTHSWLLRLLGYEPFGLHLVSIVLHAAAGVLVFLLMLEFTEIRIAWITAALFVVHPLHVEAVAWMAALPEVLAGALMLLSLYTLLRARRPDTAERSLPKRWLLAVSYLAAAAAFLTKETAMTLPVLAALLVGWRAWPFFAIAAGTLLMRLLTLGFATIPLPRRPLLEHIGIVTGAALLYAKKLVWPWPVAQEYDLTHPPVAWVVFALAGAAAAWLAYRHRQARPPLLLVVIPLAPALVSSVSLPAMRQAQDRYAYLAVLGVALLIGYAARHRAGAAAALIVPPPWFSFREDFHK